MTDMTIEQVMGAITRILESTGNVGIRIDRAKISKWLDAIDAHLAKASNDASTPYAYEYWVSNGDGTRSVEFGRRLPAYHCSDWGVKPLYDTTPTLADYERAVTEQAMLTECVSVTGRDPSDVIRDVIQWNVSNSAQPVEAVRATDSVPPRWYTLPEIEHCLQRMSYSDAVISELAPWFFRHIKSAFDKGYSVAVERAAIAHPRPTVPEGYRLVPVEPTDDMCRNAREKIGIGSNVAHHVWHWMIDAAPDGEVVACAEVVIDPATGNRQLVTYFANGVIPDIGTKLFTIQASHRGVPDGEVG